MPKEVWAKMWVNRLTHTVTHTGKCAERAKEEQREFCFLSAPFPLLGTHITCAMKLPMVCAASSCF